MAMAWRRNGVGSDPPQPLSNLSFQLLPVRELHVALGFGVAFQWRTLKPKMKKLAKQQRCSDNGP